MKLPQVLAKAGPKKLAARFEISERTAKDWIARGAPPGRRADVEKSAARSRRSASAAKTMTCRRSLLAFGRESPAYKRRGINSEWFDKERCAVIATDGDGMTVRLQILVGESGDHYPQWIEAAKVEGYQNDPEMNFAYQGKLRRKNISRLVIFFPECCGKSARATHAQVEAESEATYARTNPEWLRAYRRQRKKTSKRKLPKAKKSKKAKKTTRK